MNRQGEFWDVGKLILILLALLLLSVVIWRVFNALK